MRKLLQVLIGAIALVAIVLGAVSFAKASSEAGRVSAAHGQIAELRSELATLRSDLLETKSAVTSAKSELTIVSSEVAKTNKSEKLGYCVEYFTPQDGNVLSYNAATDNDDYTNVVGLVEGIFTPQLVNGVWQCQGGGTFVPLAD